VRTSPCTTPYPLVRHSTKTQAHPQFPPAPVWERPEIQAAILILLIFWAYFGAIPSSFHFDDFAILNDGYIAGPGFGWGIFRLGQTRPLTYLTFHWNYLAGGKDPAGYHLVNLALHAGNAILVLALARRYFPATVAGGVAALFALHPLQTEAVTYVFARSTLLSTHLALWTLWLYLRQKYAASLVMFGASLLAKEEAIAIPALLLLFDWIERRPLSRRRGYYGVAGILAAGAAVRLFYLIYASPHAPGIGRVQGISTISYFLTQSRVLWLYARLALVPLDLNLDRDVALSTNLFAPWTTLPAVAAWAAVIAALGWFVWKRERWAVWTLGFLLLIAPSSSIVAQSDVMFEHRTYLPLVCLAMAAGFLLRQFPRKWLVAGLGLLIPAMMTGAAHRVADWRDERSLWADVAEKSPNKARSWLGLGQTYINDDPDKARDAFGKGLLLDPQNADLHANLGVVLMTQHRPDEALAHFRRSMASSDEAADVWNNVGAALYMMNDFDGAAAGYRSALKLDPCYYEARRNLVSLQSRRGEVQAAFLSGEVPSGCRLIPEQAKELEALRRVAGRPGR